jgi:alpha-glucosidase
LPVKAPQLARNVASQTGIADSVLETYRAILAFRRGSKALLEGKTVFHDLPEPLLAFSRAAAGEALLCIFNLSPKVVTISLSGTAAPLSISLDAVLKGQSLVLGPNAAAFLPVTGKVALTS